jgi:hypothetical protein
MTLANAPLSARDARPSAPDLPDGTSEIFFAEGMDSILAASPDGHQEHLLSPEGVETSESRSLGRRE